MSMVHDNTIKAYCVDFEAETLTLKTQYQSRTSGIIENTDVIFKDYLAHDFEYVQKGNMIFDIEEYPLSMFFERERDILEKGKSFCWPVYYKTEKELFDFFQANNYKIFEISSSYGLSGFVFAKHMDIIVNGQLFKQ